MKKIDLMFNHRSRNRPGSKKKNIFSNAKVSVEPQDTRLAQLEVERDRLLEYMHVYQHELESYESVLESMDKCTGKNSYYENLDTRHKLERLDGSRDTLWRWIERVNEKLPENVGIWGKAFWIFDPVAIWHYRQLKKNDYRQILLFYKKNGESPTLRLLAKLPLKNAVRAKIWSDISKEYLKKDTVKAAKYATWAWKFQPRPYRLKYLAFRLYENGEHEIARNLLDALPPDYKFSESEHRYVSRIEKAVLAKPANEKKKTVIAAAMITDDNYVLPTLVAAWSLRKATATPVCLNILHSGKKDLKDFFAPLQTDSFTIRIIEIDFEDKSFELGDDFHVSTAAITKFRLPALFPEYSRLLYLDSDILVLSDPAELWNKDLEDYYAAVVEDIKPTRKYSPSQLEKLGIEKNDAYFNSGMMLLNLQKMRKDGIVEKLFNYRRNGLNFFMDQDAFNVIIGGKVKYLALKYNFLLTLFDEFKLEEINEAYHTNLTAGEMHPFPPAAIIHFCSPSKPWTSTTAPCSDLWLEYLLGMLNDIGCPAKDPLVHWNRIVVSLTSWPPRIRTAHKIVEDLKNQSLPAYKIILWLAEEEFPTGLEGLPQELLSLQDEKFEIRFCRNLRSYKKLIPTLREFADRPIATADDDQHYHRHWLWELLQSWLAAPQAVHCHRAHRMVFSYGRLENYNHWLFNHEQKELSSLLFPTGCGGIFYPPDCFMPEVLNESQFSRLCPTGDDIWFWAMAIMNGRKFCRAPGSSFELNPIDGSQEQCLFIENVRNNLNDYMIRRMLFYYPFLKAAIFGENYGYVENAVDDLARNLDEKSLSTDVNCLCHAVE